MRDPRPHHEQASHARRETTTDQDQRASEQRVSQRAQSRGPAHTASRHSGEQQIDHAQHEHTHVAETTRATHTSTEAAHQTKDEVGSHATQTDQQHTLALSEDESFRNPEMHTLFALGWEPDDHIEVGDTGFSETDYVALINHWIDDFLREADHVRHHQHREQTAQRQAAGTDGIQRLLGKFELALHHTTREIRRYRLAYRAEMITELVAQYAHHRAADEGETSNPGDEKKRATDRIHSALTTILTTLDEEASRTPRTKTPSKDSHETNRHQPETPITGDQHAQPATAETDHHQSGRTARTHQHDHHRGAESPPQDTQDRDPQRDTPAPAHGGHE